MKIIGAILTALFLLSSPALAQEEARAAWQVTNFDITANIQQTERTLNAVAILSVSNVGRGAGSSFTFRITARASVKGVTVGGATANFRSVPESFGNSQIDASVKRDLQRVTVTLPTAVAGGGTLVININYNLPTPVSLPSRRMSRSFFRSRSGTPCRILCLLYAALTLRRSGWLLTAQM